MRKLRLKGYKEFCQGHAGVELGSVPSHSKPKALAHFTLASLQEALDFQGRAAEQVGDLN